MTPLLRLALLAALPALAASLALAQPGAAPAADNAAAVENSPQLPLAREIDGMSLHDVPLHAVLMQIAQEQRMNLLIGRDVPDERVNLSLGRTTLGTLLAVLLRAQGCRFELAHSIMFVWKDEGRAATLPSRVFVVAPGAGPMEKVAAQVRELKSGVGVLMFDPASRVLLVVDTVETLDRIGRYLEVLRANTADK